MTPTFLTAEWRYLVMLNYEIDPATVTSLVPPGTEIDTWSGKTFISIVGFSFRKTRVLRMAIPLHRNFEEINLRFYVRRRDRHGWRRGVVFIKEIVPRRAIAAVARLAYNESYVSHPMSSSIQTPDPAAGLRGHAEYRWKAESVTHRIRADFEGYATLPGHGSEEEFITEHYWGYVRQRDGTTVEYRVEHPQWRVWQASAHTISPDAATFYGSPYGKTLEQTPSSCLVADGSPVAVRWGQRIR